MIWQIATDFPQIHTDFPSRYWLSQIVIDFPKSLLTFLKRYSISFYENMKRTEPLHFFRLFNVSATLVDEKIKRTELLYFL